MIQITIMCIIFNIVYHLTRMWWVTKTYQAALFLTLLNEYAQVDNEVLLREVYVIKMNQSN